MSVDTEQLTAIGSVQLKKLLDVSALLSSTLDLKLLLQTVTEVATELTHTETASILLVDHKTQELHFVVATGHSTLQNISVPKDSIAGWIVEHGEPLVLPDVRADPRFYEGVDSRLEFETRDMIGVPLLTKQHVIGALEAINKKPGRGYNERDVILLQALASQAAIAIENARLFQQSDLIAEIMHELKTPLMSITSASELLVRRKLPADTETELMEMIHRESIRMAKMTKDFLDLARMESGRFHMERQSVKVDKVINEIVRLTKAQADKRSIVMRTQVPTHLPAILGDPDRLQQVVLNLVSNAIKYNVEAGQINIFVEINGSILALSVQDTGIGLSKESREQLFERFYRVPGHSDRSEGSGLGLSIAKRIVEDHGGQIHVKSKLGHGTTFTCTFPIPAEEVDE